MACIIYKDFPTWVGQPASPGSLARCNRIPAVKGFLGGLRRRGYWVLFLAVVGSGCAYSFRGGALPPEVRTIQVEAFSNEAEVVIPTLSQTLTEAIRQKFITQTPLALTRSGGDLVLRGRITEYRVAPVAIQGGQQAAQNRLSITIFVECQSTRFPELSWQQSFMNFIDFPATANVGQLQEPLIQELSERLAQDIVNKTLSNW